MIPTLPRVSVLRSRRRCGTVGAQDAEPEFDFVKPGGLWREKLEAYAPCLGQQYVSFINNAAGANWGGF